MDSLIIHQDALNFNAIFMTLENYSLKRPAQAVPAPGAFLRKQMVYCCDSACFEYKERPYITGSLSS
ncbi:MAG: hypothetical protein DBY09_04120 [Selenomonadales bacterium]|nr:MAG: hypothetical protein DBY09_04120 [Selenomonadales bacterium]